MLDTLDLNKYDEALGRGLCQGPGNPDGQMCIEAAICYALGLPHGDDPQCVTEAVRCFKIDLNDSNWSSPKARADGLRDLGLAQLGSLGVVYNLAFAEKLALATINKLIPALYREVFPDNEKLLQMASNCEKAVDLRAARNAVDLRVARNAIVDHFDDHANANAAVYAAIHAAYAVDQLVDVGDTASAASAAAAAAYAAGAATTNDPDKYLIMAVNIALDILKELGSPGCQFLS